MTETDPFSTFKPEVRQSVEGLIWLGYLEDSFEFCGHQFKIRTLYGNEELLAAKVTKEYTETLGQAKAWGWANVALALTEVDHRDDFCPPIGPNPEEYAKARFNYVTGKWFWPLAEYIFERYAQLAIRQREAIDALRDLSAGSLRTFSPSVDSLNVPGTSSEQIDSETSS